MIFSLSNLLKPTALKVKFNSAPVSYSWGNIDALHKWIESKNKKQIDNALGLTMNKKYPLIWLAEGWVAKEKVPGVDFTNVNFYISRNSKVETLNEQRLENFDILYQVANDFIDELRMIANIKENNISYFERPNFNTVGSGAESTTKKAITSDIWDCLIVNLDLFIIPSSGDCFK